MEFDLLDGGEDDENNGIDFVEISKIFGMQDADFFRLNSFDMVY